jgi:hypothetical protein
MAAPLSVDEILAKQKAEREAAAKVNHPATCKRNPKVAFKTLTL